MAKSTPKRAIIIGGGVGGLSAAIHLAARGMRVTLLEKNARLGGKLNFWAAPHPHRPTGEHDAHLFKFDTGPSLLTLPLIFQDLFSAAGEDVRDYLAIQKLDPIARYAWSDGTTFSLRAERDDLLAEVRQLSPTDVAGFEQLLKRGESIWNLSADAFLFHAPEQMVRSSGYSPLAGLKMLTTPFRIGMFGNYARLIDKHIKHEKLRQVLYQYATYSGASPFKAPATLAVIPFVEMGFGGWYLRGGMYQLAEALTSVAQKLGVDIRTECEVQQILVQSGNDVTDKSVLLTSPGRTPWVAPPTHASARNPAASHKKPRAVGILTRGGQTILADVVIANSDVVYTYRHLIDTRFRKRYDDAALSRIEPGGSGIVLLLGVEGTYPQLAHHNKFMPDDYTSDLRAMFETHTLPADPCIYVCASTRTDPTQAPEGCENLFVLASAPALDGKIDWAIKGPQYRDQLIATLEHKCGLRDLGRRIVVQRMITPADLESMYHANAGTIYGIGSNSRRSAFLRPPNRDRDIAGLFFAGGATHPGGGLPLVALSGKIVSELVAEDLRL